jgi:hypothetical protein
MLTLKQIVQKVDAFRKEGSRYVRIVQVKKGFDSLGRGFIAAASYSTHIIGPDGKPKVNRGPHRYVTVITFLDKKLHVQCSCSCDDQQYRWEVALAEKGAAEIEYSDGSMPNTTNPSRRAACCKHLRALYDQKLAGKIPGL